MDDTIYLEKRLDKLEENQDKLSDKQDKIHEELVEVKSDLKIFVHQVEEHVSSDKKIASEIEPLVQILPSLASMVKDHEFKKERSKRIVKKGKMLGMFLGIVSTVVGIAVGISKLL